MTMLLPDSYVDRCLAEHTYPDEECEHCPVRATRQHCEMCGAIWEDGDLVNLPPRAFSHLETPHVLFDDWDRELLCTLWELAAHEKCGDPITTPGFLRCDSHQAIQR